jgi:VWFA-related protein
MDRFSDGRWRRASLQFVVLLSLIGTMSAQMPPDCRHRSGNQPCDAYSNPIRVQSPLVALPITVTDPAGNPVLDLKKGEFRVLDDNTPQKITSLSIRMQPVAAVIVIQTDEGVAPLLKQIHPLGVLFSNLLLGQPGEAAVITYADKVRLIQGFSGDPPTLERSLKGITASGGKTRMDDALVRAISMLTNQSNAKRRVVIVFSDGFDSGSKAGPLEVIRNATAGGVSIYGLRFAPTYEVWKQNDSWGPSPNAPNDGAMGGNPSEAEADSSGGGDLLAPVVMALELGRSALRRNALQQYAGFTGGIVYKHWKAQTLQDHLQKIAVEVNSEYTLTYVPNTLNKAGFHPILVEVSKPGLEVRTRAGYFYTPTVKSLSAN